jgi:hypothetical protein
MNNLLGYREAGRHVEADNSGSRRSTITGGAENHRVIAIIEDIHMDGGRGRATVLR